MYVVCDMHDMLHVMYMTCCVWHASCCRRWERRVGGVWDNGGRWGPGQGWGTASRGTPMPSLPRHGYSAEDPHRGLLVADLVHDTI